MPHIAGILLSILLTGALGKIYDLAASETSDALLVLAVLPMALLAAFITTVMIFLLSGAPKAEFAARFRDAASLGGLAGVSFYAHWWASEIPVTFLTMGIIIGLITAIPVGVTYGLAGGDNHPLDPEQTKVLVLNLLTALAMAALVGFLQVFDNDGEPFWTLCRAFGFIATAFLLTAGRFDFSKLIASISKPS